MIDQDRVRQMSRMAMMESDMGQNVIKTCAYRKADYVIMQILKGVIAGTVCYAALLFLWFGFHWDGLNAYFADAQFELFLKKVLFWYAVFMAAYLTLCGVVAAVHYRACARRKRIYLRYLKRLRRSYAAERKAEETWSSY